MQNIMEDHLFLYCAFSAVQLYPFFSICFIATMRNWPQVLANCDKKKKSVFNVMYGFRHVFFISIWKETN